MIGAGILFRIGRKAAIKLARRVGGRYLHNKGVLPSRWYLREALDALAEDNILEVIRALDTGRKGRAHKWEMIRQQAVFRCRLLKEGHARSLRRIKSLDESGRLKNTPESDRKKAVDLHREALGILSDYEIALMDLNAQRPSDLKKSRFDGAMNTDS